MECPDIASSFIKRKENSTISNSVPILQAVSEEIGLDISSETTQYFKSIREENVIK